MSRPLRSRASVIVPAAALVAFVLVAVLFRTGALSSLFAGGDAGRVLRPEDVPACGFAWRVVNSPDPSREYDELHAVSASSPDDVWAVGTFGAEDFAKSFVLRWEGRGWTQVESPSVPDYSNHLHGVAARTPEDAWIVGASHRGTGLWRTLTMRWDRSAWRIVQSPSPEIISNLNGVAAISGDDAWAVGEISTGSKGAGSRPLLLRWDGAAWSVAALPAGVEHGVLNAVTAASKDDVWAVGSTGEPASDSARPLVLHWDGKAWRTVSAPGGGTLWAVSALPGAEAWAVGTSGPRPVAMRWDGAAWSPTSVPSVGAASLNAVAAVSPSEVWVVGSRESKEGDRAFAARWDGKAWNETPAPSKGDYLTELTGVSAMPGAPVWAVGSYIADAVGTNLTMVQRYSDPCSSPTP